MKTRLGISAGVTLAILLFIAFFDNFTMIPMISPYAASLGSGTILAGWIVSVFSVANMAGNVGAGWILDRFGRRKVILAAVGLFAAASFGCMLATRIEHLWFWRAMQGITAGAGIVVSRAIVRDLFDGAAAQKLMSQITMMFALAPAIAPVIGGWLQILFGWRSVFAFLVLATAALWLACWKLLPETLPLEKRQSLRPAYLGSTYWQVMTSPAFLTACAALSLNFGGFFLYILSAPVFLMQHLGVPETGFLWLFGPGMCGLVCGSWISGRLAGKTSLGRTVAIGYAVMGSAAAINLALNLLLPPGLPWSVLPIFIYTVGMSLAMPCLSIFALDPFPAQRGLAASCQTFFQSGFNGLAAALIAPALWGSTLTLALGMAGMVLIGGSAALLHQRLRLVPR